MIDERTVELLDVACARSSTNIFTFDSPKNNINKVGTEMVVPEGGGSQSVGQIPHMGRKKMYLCHSGKHGAGFDLLSVFGVKRGGVTTGYCNVSSRSSSKRVSTPSSPITEQMRRAFRNVVQRFTRDFCPPSSFYGGRK